MYNYDIAGFPGGRGGCLVVVVVVVVIVVFILAFYLLYVLQKPGLGKKTLVFNLNIRFLIIETPVGQYVEILFRTMYTNLIYYGTEDHFSVKGYLIV